MALANLFQGVSWLLSDLADPAESLKKSLDARIQGAYFCRNVCTIFRKVFPTCSDLQALIAVHLNLHGQFKQILPVAYQVCNRFAERCGQISVTRLPQASIRDAVVPEMEACILSMKVAVRHVALHITLL